MSYVSNVTTWFVVIYCHLLSGTQQVQFRGLSMKLLRFANVSVLMLTQMQTKKHKPSHMKHMLDGLAHSISYETYVG
jgi:hypothetical protein